MQLSLSIDETLAATGLGRTKLYQLINSGDLKARKIGKRTIVLKDDLDAFLDSLEAYPSSTRGA
jgi:excisionase family DNA binding protein